jgi:hypothetical protein
VAQVLWRVQLGTVSTNSNYTKSDTEKFVYRTFSPSMRLPFYLTSGINLRVNSSSENLKDYISGTLTVDINPDNTASSAVLMGNAQFSNRQLFEASSVCLTNFFNTTEIVVHVCVAYLSTVLSVE